MIQRGWVDTALQKSHLPRLHVLASLLIKNSMKIRVSSEHNWETVKKTRAQNQNKVNYIFLFSLSNKRAIQVLHHLLPLLPRRKTCSNWPFPACQNIFLWAFIGQSWELFYRYMTEVFALVFGGFLHRIRVIDFTRVLENFFD